MSKQYNQNSQIIICKLGCINYHVTQNGDYCFGQGFVPIKICEGSRCVRKYTRVEMDTILEQEKREDKLLKQLKRVGISNKYIEQKF